MNKELYNRLSKLFRYLYTAGNANYIVGMTVTETNELYDIYNKVFKRNESNNGCSKCRLRVAKLLYSVYTEYEQKIKQKEENKKPTKKTTTTKKKK